MYKLDKFEKDEEFSDPDLVMYKEEQRRSQLEKKIFVLLLLLIFLSWFFYGRVKLIDYGAKNWGWTLPKSSTDALSEEL